MTVLERKAKLVAAILNDTNESRFFEIERMYENLSKPSFMCSLEELKEGIIQQEKDLEAGKIELIPHEQIKRKTYYED